MYKIAIKTRYPLTTTRQPKKIMRAEYAFEFSSSEDERRITIEAESIQDAMIEFAREYKNVVSVWSIQEVKPLYKVQI